MDPVVDPNAPGPEAQKPDEQPKVVEQPKPAELKVDPAAPAPKVEEPAPPAPQPKEDWRDARIAQLTAQLKAEREKKLEAPKPDPNAEPRYTQAEVERLANERATRQAQINEFNNRCNNAAAEGRKAYADFDASVRELGRLVDRSDPQSQANYDAFLEQALETGEAPRLIYELGRDLNEASRVLGLSPTQRAMALTKLALGEPKVTSDLPAPIKPVAGKQSGPGEISPDDAARADKLSSAEWHKRRAAQVAAQEPQYGRRGRG